MSTYTGSAFATKYAAYLIYKGSATAAALNISQPKIGYVYDITEGGTLTPGNITVQQGDAVVYLAQGWTHCNNGGADQAIANLSSQFEELLEEIGETDFSKFALKTELPTVPTNVSAFNNDAGYLTQHQSLANYALKKEIPDVSNFAPYSAIPQNVSQLTNDAHYLTEAVLDDRVRKVDDLAQDTDAADGEIVQLTTDGRFYRFTEPQAEGESGTWTTINQPADIASNDQILSQNNSGKLTATLGMSYNSTNQHLELKGNNSAVVSYVDMGVFIKDGMLDDALLYTTAEPGVTVEVPYLKFIFNVASGKSVIRVSLKDLVDIYDGANINLTSAFVKAATYSAPAIGDSMDVAIGKLLKGHEDNAAAISGKQDTLTFDDAPTANSNKPVTSGGLYNELRITATAIPQDVDWTTLQMVDNNSSYRILPGSYAGKFLRIVNLPAYNSAIIYMLKSEWAATPSKVVYICSANRSMGIMSFHDQKIAIAVFQDSLRKYTINTEFTENDVDYIGPREAESFTPSTTYSLKQFVELLNSSQEDMQVIIDGKQPTITGAASTITTANLTASKVLASDANGKVAATSIATTDAEDAVAKRHTQNTDTKIQSGNNKVEVSASGTTITGNGSVSGNFSVSGNLNVTGKETVEEIVNIKSENNFITLRDGAQTAIASGSLSGTKVENYDGLGNDLLFGTDASGTFRIGDDGGTLEPIATRDEAANLTDGQLMKWDAANQRMVGTADIAPQINSYVASKAMTEDAYWDLVTAGTVQADTLYITYDNDWEG